MVGTERHPHRPSLGDRCSTDPAALESLPVPLGVSGCERDRAAHQDRKDLPRPRREDLGLPSRPGHRAHRPHDRSFAPSPRRWPPRRPLVRGHLAYGFGTRQPSAVTSRSGSAIRGFEQVGSSGGRPPRRVRRFVRRTAGHVERRRPPERPDRKGIRSQDPGGTGRDGDGGRVRSPSRSFGDGAAGPTRPVPRGDC
jgi:hypothetical protein